MKNACAEEIYNLAINHRELMVVCADGLNGIFEKLANTYPTQYIDFGIAEESMVASSAGMAHAGRIPFIYGTSNFIAMRGYEFIRNDVCLPNHNVKIVGMLSGLSRPTWGPTHHGTEDMGLLRSLPNLLVITPTSPNEARSAIRYAYNHYGPMYIRIEAAGEPEYFNEEYNFLPGKGAILREGKDITIICMGSIVSVALKAAEEAAIKGISVRVITMPTINPLDSKVLFSAFSDTKGLITLEEHSIWGGIGTAVAEFLVDNRLSIRLEKLGLREPVKICGDRSFLRKQYGLGVESVLNAIDSIMGN
jgi:transketolase